MVGRLVGTVAAASALTAHAFLIPPGVQSIDETVQLQVVNTNWQSIKLPCPECVFPAKQNEVEGKAEADNMWAQGGANSLHVNVSTLFDRNAVGIKDYALYPPLKSYAKAMVDMIRSESTMGQLQDGTASRVPVEVSADTVLVKEEQVSPNSDSVLHINYQIMSIDRHPVTVDGVEVVALKGKDGKLDILNVEAVPKANTIFDALPPQVSSNHAAASSPRPCSLPAPICQFRDMVEAKLKQVHSSLPHLSLARLGCHGRKGKPNPEHKLVGHLRPPHLVDMPPHQPDGHHGRPHSFNKHPELFHQNPHHEHYHHHHSGLHRALSGVLFVIVPIFLGITMGMLVSLVGMVIGRLIAFVWMRFVRGGRKGYASVRLSEEEAVAQEESKDDVESVASEPLPEYEEAPAYDEKDRA